MSWYTPKRKRVAIMKFGDGRTVQDGEQHDIKNIVNRAMRAGGLLSNVSVRVPSFQDIADAPSYVDALNVVAEATHMFEQLPAKLRDRFGNSPQKLLAFLDDPENRQEAIKLGLVKPEEEPPPPPAPMKVEIVNPPVVSKDK